ncbi:MAG TPA: NUDIX hydrolase [Alphaproteobacteria bacterium]|nr:NUDIX hydrolase [Alphaproteobacteria bacterium]
MVNDPRRYPSRPFAAVGVVVWKGDQLLIVKRAKPPREGQWSLIGGALELGETHFECAAREAKEEAGIIIQPFGIITAIDSLVRDAQGKAEYHYSIVEVNARWLSGEPVAGDGVSEARWISLAELEKLDVWSEMKRVAKLANAQRQQS